MIAMVFVSFALANVQSIVWITSDWMVSTILPAVIVSDTNDEREQNGVTPLTRSAILDAAATMKAKHMAANQYFAHYSPDGVSPWHWFDEAGYPFVHAGENLAIYFTDSSDIVDAWMASPAHRANILDENYQEIGIGVAEGEYEGYQTVYVVQLFGTPAAEGGTKANANDTREASAATSAARPEVAGVSDTGPVAGEPRVGVDHDTVTLSLDHLSTSRDGVARDPSANVYGPESATWFGLLTQPRTVLELAYVALCGFVLIMLVLSLIYDARRRQARDFAYGMGLMFVMLVLFEIHLAITGGGVII
jgi:hypothetical protein